MIEAIANSGGKLPERQVALKVALPMLNALKHLHSTGIVHRCAQNLTQAIHVNSKQACLGVWCNLRALDMATRAVPRVQNGQQTSSWAAKGHVCYLTAAVYWRQVSVPLLNVSLLTVTVLTWLHGHACLSTETSSLSTS